MAVTQSEIDQLIASLLLARGIDPAAQAHFLRPDYTAGLHDPWLLPDAEAAVHRLVRAAQNKEVVGIYGDYDVDGLSATALLLDAFSSFGIATKPYIPSRFGEGYGLSKAGIDMLKKRGVSLIVTVDCGTSAVNEIAYAASKGIDVIVTDHHEPPAGDLPVAVAIVNPKRHDSAYPFSQLCGAGVAFKLVCALQSRLDGLPFGQEKWLLDLVALATVSDVVPLIDENRTLTYYGLMVLANGRRIGLRELAAVAGLIPQDLRSMHLGFVLGPRLNAAGRMAHASAALDLLTEQSTEVARRHAAVLEELNQSRRSAQTAIEEQALTMIESMAQDRVLVVGAEGWSHGVVGIVAARLLETNKKPVFIMNYEGNVAIGSARSFGDFHAADALNAVRGHLLSGGGHAGAAGFKLDRSKVDAFRADLNAWYDSLGLADQSHHLNPSIDYVFNDVRFADVAVIEALSQLEPFGFGNQSPLFSFDRVRVQNSRRVGSDKAHMQLDFVDERGNLARGIYFRAPHDVPIGSVVTVVGSLEPNEFNGWVNAQIVVRSLKIQTN